MKVSDNTQRQLLEDIRALQSKNDKLKRNSRELFSQEDTKQESQTNQTSQENRQLHAATKSRISENKIKNRQSVYLHNTNKMLLIGVGLTAFFWILESGVHVFVFHYGSFLDQVLPSNYHELLMRLLICFVLMCFSVYAQIIVRKLGQSKVELQQSHNNLEIQIREHTAELANTNDKLLTEINERKKAQEKLIEYQQQLRYLASELTRAEEEARRRIAVELHDKIGHDLALAKIKTESLHDQLAGTESSVQANEVIDMLVESMKDVSSFIFELSPAVLYELGLDAAVEWLAKDFEKKSGIYCQFNSDGQGHLLSKELQVLLYRSIRELLVNVRKHAHAEKVSIISGEDLTGYSITIEDDGVGFEPSSSSMLNRSSGGFGLFSVIERLDYQGGSCEIESRLQEGTKITLFIPKNKMRCSDGVKVNCGG